MNTKIVWSTARIRIYERDCVENELVKKENKKKRRRNGYRKGEELTSQVRTIFLVESRGTMHCLRVMKNYGRSLFLWELEQISLKL